MATREKVQALPKPIRVFAFLIFATTYICHCITNNTSDMPEGWHEFFNQP